MTDDDAKDMHRLAVGGPVLTPLERELLAALQMARLLLVEIENYSVDGTSVLAIDAVIRKATGGKA